MKTTSHTVPLPDRNQPGDIMRIVLFDPPHSKGPGDPVSQRIKISRERAIEMFGKKGS